MADHVRFMFWNTDLGAPRNRRYWLIASGYQKDKLWLFYLHEGNQAWTTFKEVDQHYLNMCQTTPGFTELVEQSFPNSPHIMDWLGPLTAQAMLICGERDWPKVDSFKRPEHIKQNWRDIVLGEENAPTKPARTQNQLSDGKQPNR